jgi:hypothetical protein
MFIEIRNKFLFYLYFRILVNIKWVSVNSEYLDSIYNLLFEYGSGGEKMWDVICVKYTKTAFPWESSLWGLSLEDLFIIILWLLQCILQ